MLKFAVVFMSLWSQGWAGDDKLNTFEPIEYKGLTISVENGARTVGGRIPVFFPQVIATQSNLDHSKKIVWSLEPPEELFPKDPGPEPKGITCAEYATVSISVKTFRIEGGALLVSYAKKSISTELRIDPLTGKEWVPSFWQRILQKIGF